ncbi:hypothetical protein LTR17_004951 [Elasticomyces elasticus]|nr:hypothetical protein LTR17_004951 [Elasticomyces elasticus]
MENRLCAGLAWALPVKPVDLLVAIDAYMTALPAIQALRKCARFGYGPQAHITKLPVEMVSAIEAIMYDEQLRSPNDKHLAWEQEFLCYTSTCAPADHFKNPGLNIGRRGNGTFAEVEDTRCQPCSENSQGEYNCECTKGCTSATPPDKRCWECKVTPGTSTCEQICPNASEEAMQQGCTSAGFRVVHEKKQDKWASRISPKAFAKYAKVLNTEFGLDVHFAATAKSKHGGWPPHKRDRWHWDDMRKDGARKTTLCYLTLPKQSGPNSAYALSEFESDMAAETHEAELVAAQALEIDIASLAITDTKRRRFQRALRTLQLELSTHGSQVYPRMVSANAHNDCDIAVAEDKASTESKDVMEANWPRLLLLVQSFVEYGG